MEELHSLPLLHTAPVRTPNITATTNFAVVMTDSEHLLSDYEKLRLERIRKNEEKLRQLGLSDFASSLKPKRKPSPKKKKSPTAPKGQERRSARLRSDGEKPTIELTEEEFEREERILVLQSTPRCRRRVSMDGYTKLSDKDRRSLEGSVDNNYLSKFEEFLQYHDKISEQNCRSVMRQITKLAHGEGIRYESPRYGWKPGCYFRRGDKITPLSDIVELMQEAQDCEDRWGRDHGNGWLLSHPLKKLLLFQQFVLNNPSFLQSKCRINEFEQSADNSPSADDDDKDTGPPPKQSVAVPPKPSEDHVGSRVAKVFSGATYFGTIDGYASDTKFWHVTYDDTDQEEFNFLELEQALAYYDTVQDDDDDKNKKRVAKKPLSGRSKRARRVSA